MRTDKQILGDEHLGNFGQRGFVLLKGFYDIESDIEPIWRGIYEVIGQVMQRHGVDDNRPSYSPERFDAGFNALIQTDRALGGEVYDAVKQLAPFLRLVSHVKNERLYREVRPGCVPGIAGGGYGIRIDNPYEERFMANWHQEYPSQLRSLDGCVFWSPLVPITSDIGPVNLCPGSHLDGAKPVNTSDARDPAKQGAYALVLHDEERVVAKYVVEAPVSEPGDLMIMDFLLLHRSGANRTGRSRWSMQFRYFNFADPTGRAHGWKGSFASGIDFRSIHPELCAD